MSNTGTLTFAYTDAQGFVTNREIRNARQDGFYLRGFDLNANGVRTFRIDRIRWDGDELPDISISEQPFNLTPPHKLYKNKQTVCFTGFSRDRALPALLAMAESSGLSVAKSVVSKLTYLVTGSNAGPAKLDKAQAEGASILTEDEFINLIETGELPDTVKWEKLPNPEKYFHDWHYCIHRALWPALGVRMRDFVNKERTAGWRYQWELDNPRYTELKPLFFRRKHKEIKDDPCFDEWEELKKQRAELSFKDRIYALSTPRQYDFHEGDMFYGGELPYLQVVATTPILEIKTTVDNRVVPYHIPPCLLADWLQSGKRPDDSYQVDKNQSLSQIAKHYEYT